VERRGFHPVLRRRAVLALATWAIAFSLLAIANAIPLPPTAVLEADDTSPAIGEPVHFDASRSIGHDEGNGVIVAYRFGFGDGSGTDWQASPFAEHAYDEAGSYFASLEVRDRRDLVGRATLEIRVWAVPPPTGPEPDLAPVAASPSPPRPEEDDIVTVAVTIANQGGSAAQSASVDVVDVRPSGSEILVDSLPLDGPLAPGSTRVLTSTRFLAVGVGNHTLRIRIHDVSPKETRTEDNELEVPMEVRARTAGGGDTGARGIVVDPVVLGLIGAAIVALVGALAVLARPAEERPLVPPPPEPPDRRPPPIWPP